MTDEEEYKKGFNEGYMIAEHLPALAQSIAAIDSKAPRIEGMKDGHKQYLSDKAKKFQPEWRRRREHGNNGTRNKGRDMQR